MNHIAKKVGLWMDVLASTTDRVGKFELELIIVDHSIINCCSLRTDASCLIHATSITLSIHDNPLRGVKTSAEIQD